MLPVCRQNSESHHDRGRAQKIKGGDIAESPRFSGHTSETGQVHSSSLPRGSRRSVQHQLHIFASARPGDTAPLGNYDGKVMWQRAGSRGRTAHRLLRRTLEEKQEERFAKVAHQTRETWRRAGAAAGRAGHGASCLGTSRVLWTRSYLLLTLVTVNTQKSNTSDSVLPATEWKEPQNNQHRFKSTV